MLADFQKLLESKNLPIQVYFDVGANIGNFTMAIKELYPNSKCHAFEPVSSIYQTLKSNLVEYDDVYLNNILVSNKSNTEDFVYIDPRMSTEIVGTCTRYEKDPMRRSGVISQWKKQNVGSITLSNYIELNNITNIDLIKIDVEGFEYAVIDGLLKYLTKTNHLPYLYVEVGWGTLHPEWDAKCHPVYRKLFETGYKPVTFSNHTEDILFEPIQ